MSFLNFLTAKSGRSTRRIETKSCPVRESMIKLWIWLWESHVHKAVFPFDPIIYLYVCQSVEICRFTPFIQGLFRPFEFNLFNTKIRGYLCPSYTEFKFKWISEKWIKNDTFHVMERGRWYLDLSVVRERFKIGPQRSLGS